MNRDIVLLSGKMGSGKTTTANALREAAKRAAYDIVYTIKFADPLYELHEFILNKMEGWTGITRVKKDGSLLQVLGTEWGRTLDENVWVGIADKKILEAFDRHGSKNVLIIIDDARFPNEFDAYPDALRVRLEATKEIRQARADSWRDKDNHPSEISLDEYASLGRFDMYLHTDNESYSTDSCVSLILSKLQRKSWKEKREAIMTLNNVNQGVEFTEGKTHVEKESHS